MFIENICSSIKVCYTTGTIFKVPSGTYNTHLMFTGSCLLLTMRVHPSKIKSSQKRYLIFIVGLPQGSALKTDIQYIICFKWSEYSSCQFVSLFKLTRPSGQ